MCGDLDILSEQEKQYHVLPCYNRRPALLGNDVGYVFYSGEIVPLVSVLYAPDCMIT